MKTAPTIGRVVLYWPTDYDNGNFNFANVEAGREAQPMAATVAHVWDDNVVNLTVSGHDGNTFGKTSVTMVNEEDSAGPGMCEWMPYQKEAALRWEESNNAIVLDASNDGEGSPTIDS